MLRVVHCRGNEIQPYICRFRAPYRGGILCEQGAGNWLSPDELSALFTGLGFVGVIAAFRHEREQAADNDKEHGELLAAMRDQVSALVEQAKVGTRTARIQAAASVAATMSSDISSPNRIGQLSPQDLYHNRAPFVKRLWEEAEKAFD